MENREKFEEKEAKSVKSVDFEEIDEVFLEGVESVVVILPRDIDFSLLEAEDEISRLILGHRYRDGVRISREGNKLNISITREPGEDYVEMELRLSHFIPVEIAGDNGDIQCENILGDIKVEGKSCDILVRSFNGQNASFITKNGDLDIIEARGALNINTESGDVLLEEFSGEAHVNSISGDIEVYHMDGEIGLSSRSGNIEGTQFDGKTSCKTSSGDIEISGASGEISLKSKSGDIEVDRSMGSFNLETRSGNVEARKITIEKFHAKSSTGNIEMNIEIMEEGSKMDVETSSGTILLRLPRGCDGKMLANANSGHIESRVKMFKYDVREKRTIEGNISGSKDIILPNINLMSESGKISIRH